MTGKFNILMILAGFFRFLPMFSGWLVRCVETKPVYIVLLLKKRIYKMFHVISDTST